MGKDAPDYPDPAETAKKVGELNQATNERNFKQNAINRSGPGGSSTFTYDANGMPAAISNQLSPYLESAFNNTTGAFGGQTAAMPSGGLNYDTSTVNNILNTGMQTYDKLAADPNRQQMEGINQQIANRGLPINDKISMDLTGNAQRQQDLARQSAFSTLYGQTPGMQSTLDQNTIRQGMAPGTMATQSLGLLQGLNGMVPQAPQPVSNEGSAGPTFAQETQNKFNADTAAYNANQQALGGLLKGVGSLVTMPLAGPLGLSNTILGSAASGLGGLFNGSAGIGSM